MKGDEVVKFVEHLANNNLLVPVMGHMNNYVCKLFELQNLCVFGVPLRRSLVLDEQLGFSQKPGAEPGNHILRRASNHISWTYDTLVKARVDCALPHPHAVIDNVARADDLVVGKARSRIGVSIRL